MINFNDQIFRRFFFETFEKINKRKSNADTSASLAKENKCKFCKRTDEEVEIFYSKQSKKWCCWDCKDKYQLLCPYCSKYPCAFNCALG